MSRNYRFFANVQVIINADPRLVVATTRRAPGTWPTPTARRQGLAAAVTAALFTQARNHGAQTVLLAYAQESAARIYRRLGFCPADATLLIANQPTRS